MRILIAIAGLALLGGCNSLESAAIKDCESRLLSSIKTPSTYSPKAKSSTRIESKKAIYQHVSIEYDAQNSYGALVRETYVCFYPVDGTDIREDLDGDVNDPGAALDGQGYYARGVKLPTRGERQAAIEREVDNDMNETD